MRYTYTFGTFLQNGIHSEARSSQTILRQSRLNDTRVLRPGKLPGYICCQAPDLLNRQSALFQRIDMLFSFEYPTKVRHAEVLGATVSAKTPPPGHGLWPSDHGALIAELQF